MGMSLLCYRGSMGGGRPLIRMRSKLVMEERVNGGWRRVLVQGGTWTGFECPHIFQWWSLELRGQPRPFRN